MKRIIVVFCLILLVSSLMGCSRKYDLIKINNQDYLVIDENKTDINITLENEETEIIFKSVEEFVNTVKNGELNNEQLAFANQKFEKDFNGIKICDLLNLKVPVTPNDIELDSFLWKGNKYSYRFKCGSAYGFFEVLEKSTYDIEKENVTTGVGNDSTRHIKEIKNRGEITDYYFTPYSESYGPHRASVYAIENAEEKLTVEEYYPSNYQLLTNTLDAPARITVYGEEAEEYFKVTIYGFPSKPTVEWLSQFGIEDYKG